MKIVSLEEFLKLPAGTLFLHYEPAVFGRLLIKGDSLSESKDCWIQEIADAVCHEEFSDGAEALIKAENGDASIPMNFHLENRHGPFTSEQKFAVWEGADVLALIGRLKEAYIEGYTTKMRSMKRAMKRANKRTGG